MNKVFKALSDPTRRRVLELLKRGPMSAGELSAEFNVSKPTMSAHFSVLKEANLVEATKVGKMITYQLKMSVLEEALMGFASVFGIQLMGDGEAPQTDATVGTDTGTNTQSKEHQDNGKPDSLQFAAPGTTAGTTVGSTVGTAAGHVGGHDKE